MLQRTTQRKKVDQLFFNDPERGQQVIESVRRTNEANRRKSKDRKKRRDQIQIA